jgi:membrane-bound lytic murein transglycosylase A
MRFLGSFAICAAAMLGGCVKQPLPAPTTAMVSVRFDQIPGWATDSQSKTFGALLAECHRLGVLPADTALGGEGLASTYGGKVGHWSAGCTAAASLAADDSAAIRRFYENWFQPYRLLATGLFTGYYEPEVQGARVQDAAHNVPLFARPADLVQMPPPAQDRNGPPRAGRVVGGVFKPYYSRAEIEAGAMGNAARPLLWLHDAVDLFFLQIQGAGRVRLADGSVIRVGYDGKNGLPYTPIGRLLIERNAITPADISMQTIKAWLEAHPGDAKALMDQNEDYVFFRILNDTDNFEGPPGALGVALVAGRSAAIDPHVLPLGAPIFIDTTDPITGAPLRRLLLAQDSGTDIKGPARTDIFFGFGPLAEQEAGRMHQQGTEYLLLPRPVM